MQILKAGVPDAGFKPFAFDEKLRVVSFLVIVDHHMVCGVYDEI